MNPQDICHFSAFCVCCFLEFAGQYALSTIHETEMSEIHVSSYGSAFRYKPSGQSRVYILGVAFAFMNRSLSKSNMQGTSFSL